MQLSVTQTITSTENNYKGNVNFGDRLFVSESKNKPQNEKEKTNRQKTTTYKNESQFIDTEEKRKTKKIHISTAYKDNNKYTVYKREIKKKTNRKNNLYLETLETKTTFKLAVTIPAIATYVCDSLLEVYVAIDWQHEQQQKKLSNFRQN